MPISKEQLRCIIGENIRQERLVRDLTIDELSELLDLTPSFLGLIERGSRGTTPLCLLKISEVLGLPIDHFFRHNQKQGNDKHTNLRNKLYALAGGFSERELCLIVLIAQNIHQTYHK